MQFAFRLNKYYVRLSTLYSLHAYGVLNADITTRIENRNILAIQCEKIIWINQVNILTMDDLILLYQLRTQ